MQLKEEVRQLREQITEPIKIDHLEIARGGTQELFRETNKKLEEIIQAQNDRGGKLEALDHAQQDLKRNQEEIFNALSQRIVDEGKETRDFMVTMKNEIIDAIRNISSPGKN